VRDPCIDCKDASDRDPPTKTATGEPQQRPA
jgi:hypothetical protein